MLGDFNANVGMELICNESIVNESLHSTEKFGMVPFLGKEFSCMSCET